MHEWPPFIVKAAAGACHSRAAWAVEVLGRQVIDGIPETTPVENTFFGTPQTSPMKCVSWMCRSIAGHRSSKRRRSLRTSRASR